MSAPARSPVPARRRWCLFVAIAGALATACSESPAAASSSARHGRLGSLRDLVLVQLPGRPSLEVLFVDRFEATRADWAEFAASPAGRAVAAEAVDTGGDPTLPATGLDLRQARAFAQWRCLRLPARDEWELVATGDGHSQFPWGDQANSSRANTAELGLLEPTPVGTFESGRRAGGDQPYDLIGNASEWTETVPWRWFREELDAPTGAPRLRDRVLRSRALAAWSPALGVLPAGWLAQAGGETVPREVVGSDFQAHIDAVVDPVPAGDRRHATGVRLYGSAADLVAALCALATEPTAAEIQQLREFLRRPGHREPMVAAFERWPARPDTAFARRLAIELGLAAESPR